jgi:hypothetical protein
VQVVLQEHGDAVAAAQAARVQELRQLLRAVVELAVGDDGAARSIDRGRLVGELRAQTVG